MKNPWEKLFEVQAHSQAVERLRLSFDNSVLFSAGRDGSLCLFDVKDKEPKLRKDGKELTAVSLSNETLLPKTERDKFKADVFHLRMTILQ